MSVKAHLASALRGSGGGEPDPAAMLAAALGMAVPVAVGAWTGHLAPGLAAAVGALLVGTVAGTGDARARIRALVPALATAGLAMVAAVGIAGHGWRTDAAMVLIAVAVATLGGFSRPLAEASARFTPLFIIVLTVAEGSHAHVRLLWPIGAGAFWGAALAIGFASLARALGWPGATAKPPAAPSGATFAQKFARWKRTLGQFAGWQYATRLGLCLGIAGALRSLWPGHHLLWIALTVAILARRQLEASTVAVTQRAIGTALGVAATAPIAAFGIPAWALALAIGPLAAARPWLRERHYLAYSACMTPLVILVLDAGRPVGLGVLADRLAATLAGGALVVATNRLFARLAPKAA